jgi:hypothetical protein
LEIAEVVCNEQFKDAWTQKQKDQLYAALILHDGWKCGLEDDLEVYTEEEVERKNLKTSIIGMPKSRREHPEIAYRQLLLLLAQYNKIAEENKIDKLGSKNFEAIAKAVRFHSGPFLKLKDIEFSLSYPFDTVVIQTHNIDFLQTKMSMLKRK